MTYTAEDMHRDFLLSRQADALARTPLAFRKPFEPRESITAERLNQATRWAAEFNKTSRGLYLHSATTGTGKSHLAYHIAYLVDCRGFKVERWNMVALLDEIRANFNLPDGEYDNGIVPICCEADLLLLDDLGCEKSNAWVNQQVYRIINERYEQSRPVIITANYTGKQQEAHMGGGDDAHRICSRLAEMVEPWSFEGIKDQRLCKR